MIHKHVQYYFRHIKDDLPAGIVVFLVALPLCLGIALASGAPLFSGLIAGFVGGLVVSWLSGSQLSVSGPAAGLTVIVFNAIETLGSFQGLLLAGVLAGVLQILLGYLRAGIIGAFFPSAVIKGMLAAIGLILIIKQIPHATGYDNHYEGDESYMRETASSSFSDLLQAFQGVSQGAMAISLIALGIILLWETSWIKRRKWLSMIPAPLLVVIWGVSYNFFTLQFAPDWSVSDVHLVKLPVTEHLSDFWANFMFPDFSYFTNPKLYQVAFTIAIIASLETLLSLEATDKLDPLKRIAPTNRELKAQGWGNIISCALGGLPITAVIVRSAANINAGGKTSLSCFLHGCLLLSSVLFFAQYLNYIPLPALSAILLHTGYKLAKPALFIEFYTKGMSQFIPFLMTVVVILLTDLLIGISLGMVIGLFFVLKTNYSAAISLVKVDDRWVLSFNKDVSFLNKALLRKCILQIPENSIVVVDATKAHFIDHDILETLEDFLSTAPDDNIHVEITGLYDKEEIKQHDSLTILNKLRVAKLA